MTQAPPQSPSETGPPTGSRGARGAGGRGTGAHGTDGRSLAYRLAFTVATLLSVSILVVTAGGWAVYHYFDGQIHRFRIDIGGDRPPDAVAGTTNYLLVGSDSRSGTGNEFSKGDVVDGERSDTTMLAHLAADGTTTLVSFPRDTLVRIPGHGRNKLNAAVSLGGPSLLIETIEDLTDIRIDHYVSIDLAGFRDMTDAIGGVTVCVKPLPGGSRANLYDPMSQWRGQVGENHLDGATALAFVRQRYGLPGGDFDRIRRQQQFISAVLERATSTGVLANPTKLESLLSAATTALTVDDSTDIDHLRTLATRLRGVSADQVRFETIPVRPPTRAEGANAQGLLAPWGSVQIYEPRRLDAFFDHLRGREREGRAPAAASGATTRPLGPASPAASEPVPDPSAVRVDVYNATGRAGLAADVADQLAAAGFDVGQPRNWPGGVVSTSQVRHAPGRLAAARTVAAMVPDAMLASDASLGRRVSLVLGRSFTGASSPSTSSRGIEGSPGFEASPGVGASRSTGGVDRPPVAGPGPGDSETGTVGSAGGRGAVPADALALPSPEPTAVTAAELAAGCTY